MLISPSRLPPPCLYEPLSMSASTGKTDPNISLYSTKQHDSQHLSPIQDLFHACLDFARQLSQSRGVFWRDYRRDQRRRNPPGNVCVCKNIFKLKYNNIKKISPEILFIIILCQKDNNPRESLG